MADFKARCVKDDGDSFTKGKTYEVVNGRICFNSGSLSSHLYNFDKVEDLNRVFNSQFELVTDEYTKGTMPKLEQIQEFDLVKLRNGHLCMIVGRDDGLAIVNKKSVFSGMYNAEKGLDDDTMEDLTDDCVNEFDIIAYKHFKSHREAIHYFVNEKEPEWDWIRQEPKEVTMKEVEDKFGCPVKIVKEGEK